MSVPIVSSIAPARAGAVAVCLADRKKTVADQLIVRGAREHNLKDIHARPATRRADRLHRPVRLRQVEPGLRHDLRRGPASLRRVAVRLRPAVPRPDGQAGRRLHRGTVPGGVDRPEVDLAATRARRSARSPRSTTTCGCCSPGSASRTARSAASRSPSRPRSRSSTASWRCPRAPGSRCWPRSSGSARASTSTCSPTCRPRATPGSGSTAWSTRLPSRRS